MLKRLLLALTVIGLLAVGAGMPSTASAEGRHQHHHGHHGHHHRHWHRPVIVYPPIVYGGYYPARYYVGYPYWEPHGGYYAQPYYGYYGSGVRVSVGW